MLLYSASTKKKVWPLCFAVLPQASRSSLPAASWMPWPSELPVGVGGIDACPLAPSNVIAGIEFDHNSHRIYTTADTWYPQLDTSSDPPVIVSPFMDGTVETANGEEYHAAGGGANACQGFATLSNWKDPLNITVERAGCLTSTPFIPDAKVMPDEAGRYASGQLVVNGTWFYGTYQLNAGPEDGTGCVDQSINKGMAWCRLSAFVGFRTSTDRGTTWKEPRPVCNSTSDNIFGERSSTDINVKTGPWMPIKFGAPNVVDFGANNQYSPDGKMYIVGYGGSRKGQWLEWNAADEVYLARVMPTEDAVGQPSAFEFWSWPDRGWTRGNVDLAQPILVWNNRTGTVTITFVPALNRFIMTITSPTASAWPFQNVEYDTYFADSDQLVGPYSLITYAKHFGPQAYFVSIPSFWLSSQVIRGEARGEDSDVFEFVMTYSANWRTPWRFNASLQNPPGSTYGFNVIRSRLILKSGWEERVGASLKSIRFV